MLQYYLLPQHKFFRPYVGVGINYTTFFNEDASANLEAALGAKTAAKIDDSVGIAGHAGIDWMLTDSWFLNTSVWYMDIDTQVTLKTAGVNRAADVDIDPWGFMFAIGTSF